MDINKTDGGEIEYMTSIGSMKKYYFYWLFDAAVQLACLITLILYGYHTIIIYAVMQIVLDMIFGVFAGIYYGCAKYDTNEKEVDLAKHTILMLIMLSIYRLALFAACISDIIKSFHVSEVVYYTSIVSMVMPWLATIYLAILIKMMWPKSVTKV